ncbi:restriction endonuclease subunit S [Lysinibacillus macroides]|uniref:Type I restriction modification DNA specificity domain-containing protein n=1 Tax=Lysinibacillus macroides TaxID=33935 RepID=A0A0N0CUI2_9BACI|nr:restriction endonuclease subunit S [Lysinibacillus macroides]KOY80271.1 hypothetical protein ADM90_20700 [Lysinibacillus macroides]QPR67576.1 restriction endonuclease subunit S [Lysinibacillus macroides]
MNLIDLGSLVNIKTGRLDANASTIDGAFPFFTCSIQPLRISTYSYDTECVLVAGNGDLNVKYYKGKFDAYQRTYIIESKDKSILDVKYLYWFMKKYIEKLRQQTIGGVIKYIKLGNLTSAKIPLFEIDIQRKIVNVLEKSNGIIKKRQFQIVALDELTQSVFLDMFGDPFYNPKGWKIGKIADLTKSTQYGTSSKANEGSGDFPILRMNNITYNGNWDFSALKYIDLDEKEQEKYLVHKGELLFNRTNSRELVGKTAVYRNDIPSAYAGYLVKLIPNIEANAEFIAAYLNSAYGKRVLLNKAKSIVGMANINAQELKAIDIYLPPKKLQDDYAYKIQSILKYREQLKGSLESYNNLYNSLLQKAFKGELFQELV